MLYFLTREHVDFGGKKKTQNPQVFISQDGTSWFSMFRIDSMFTNVLLVVIETKYYLQSVP